MEVKKYIFILSFFIFGCKSSSLLIDNSITLDANNQLINSLRIQNFTKDTLLLPVYLNILPRDKRETNQYLELYKINKRTLDTIKSDDFHINLAPLDYLFEEEELSIELPPLSTHKYNFNVNEFYSPLNKGRYLLRICFEPEFLNERDTCIVSRFRIKENLGNVNLIQD